MRRETHRTTEESFNFKKRSREGKEKVEQLVNLAATVYAFGCIDEKQLKELTENGVLSKPADITELEDAYTELSFRLSRGLLADSYEYDEYVNFDKEERESAIARAKMFPNGCPTFFQRLFVVRETLKNDRLDRFVEAYSLLYDLFVLKLDPKEVEEARNASTAGDRQKPRHQSHSTSGDAAAAAADDEEEDEDDEDADEDSAEDETADDEEDDETADDDKEQQQRKIFYRAGRIARHDAAYAFLDLPKTAAIDVSRNADAVRDFIEMTDGIMSQTVASFGDNLDGNPFLIFGGDLSQEAFDDLPAEVANAALIGFRRILGQIDDVLRRRLDEIAPDLFGEDDFEQGDSATGNNSDAPDQSGSSAASDAAAAASDTGNGSNSGATHGSNSDAQGADQLSVAEQEALAEEITSRMKSYSAQEWMVTLSQRGINADFLQELDQNGRFNIAELCYQYLQVRRVDAPNKLKEILMDTIERAKEQIAAEEEEAAQAAREEEEAARAAEEAAAQQAETTPTESYDEFLSRMLG